LPTAICLARERPDLDLVDHDLPSVAALEERAKRAEAAGLAVKGVTKSEGASASAGIGGMVAGHQPRLLRLLHDVEPRRLHVGDRRRGDRDGARLRLLVARHAADLDAPERIGRTAGERAVERLNPRKVSTKKVRLCSTGGSRAGSSGTSPPPSTALQSRARPASCATSWASAVQAGIRIVETRCAAGLRSRPFDGEGVARKAARDHRGRRAQDWLLDCTTARELDLATTGHAQRGVSSPPSPGPTNLHLEPGARSPQELIADIAEGFYVTELIGMGVNPVTGDYSRGASGFWIENGKRTYPVSEVTIAGNLVAMFGALEPANDLEFPLRHQRPDIAAGGSHRCGTLTAAARWSPPPAVARRRSSRGRRARAPEDLPQLAAAVGQGQASVVCEARYRSTTSCASAWRCDVRDSAGCRGKRGRSAPASRPSRSGGRSRRDPHADRCSSVPQR